MRKHKKEGSCDSMRRICNDHEKQKKRRHEQGRYDNSDSIAGGGKVSWGDYERNNVKVSRGLMDDQKFAPLIGAHA